VKIHLIIKNICLVISIVCLGYAYILAGYWLIMPALAAMVFFWIIMKKWSVIWSASGLLSIYVLLAAIGVVIDLPLILMAVGCISALASWDFVHFDQSMIGNPPIGTVERLAKKHLQSLTAMFGLSLFLTIAGSSFSLRFPFGVVVFLVLLATGCLTYAVKYIKKSGIAHDEQARDVS